ncbi:MAG: helix-turn-helix domain-containing protein, partial [Muribaculaceae bacterium]|nr:helix-turn-helix domain-containing protein [Muribaculaceae bacterium]
EASGRSPKEWINIRVMLEAKVLLRDPSRSIQEISEILGFPNQSFFGTFFKKMKGLSPSAYRNTIRIT